MEGWDGLFAVASEGPATGSNGELRAIRKGALVTTLPVAARPMWLGEVGEGLCVVASKAATFVDPETLQVTATIPLGRDGKGVVDDDDRSFEVLATADGRRAFIHYTAQDKVAVLDLEHGKALGSTQTGRGGKKILNSMVSTLTHGAMDKVYFYNPGDPPQMLLRPYGRFAYALNLDTSDMTVVDADSAAAVEKIGAGGRMLALLGESTLAVLGSEMHLIDTARNAKIGQVELPKLQGFRRSDDGAYAVALARGTVLILDGATGQERARLVDFVNPTRLAFAKNAETSEPTTP